MKIIKKIIKDRLPVSGVLRMGKTIFAANIAYQTISSLLKPRATD